MATYVFDKNLLLENLKNFIGDEEIIILSTTPMGSIKGATKKCAGKTIGLGFSSGAFKNPETISDILSSKVMGLIIGKKEILSDNYIKQMEEKVK